MLAMIWMLLGGLLLNPKTLGDSSWLLWLSPLNYAFRCLMINEFADHSPYNIQPVGVDVKAPAFTGNQVLDQFIIKKEQYDGHFAGLCGITLGAMLVSYLLQRFYLKEKR